MDIFTKQMEDIRFIEFDSIRRIREKETYSESLAMFWDWKELVGKDTPVRIKVSALTICESGTAELRVDLKRYSLSEGSILFLASGQIVRVEHSSENFKPLCIVVTDKLMNDILYKVEGLSEFILEVRDNALLNLSPSQYSKLKESYEYLSSSLRTDSPFKSQIIEHQIISLFYECYGFIKRLIPDREVIKGRSEELFNRFMSLLKAHYTKEHEPSFYADKLAVSSKYLSQVCKRFSGKSIKKWIDEYLIIEAQVLLGSTEKTIQQIAWELNFEDAALFGKFFKRIVGISPKEYRLAGANAQ